MISANLAYFRSISTNKALENLYISQNILRLSEYGDGSMQCQRDWMKSVRCPKGWVIKSHEQIKRVCVLYAYVSMCVRVCVCIICMCACVCVCVLYAYAMSKRLDEER